mgnify:CR=1 FL=1
MNTRTPKVEENKSRSVASSVVQNKKDGKQGFGFVDNRSEAVAQRKTNRFRAHTETIQQLEETGNSHSNGNSGSSLLAMIAEFDAFIQSCAIKGEKREEESLCKEMEIRITELKKVALSGTETEKKSVLEALKNELGKNNIKSGNGLVVQREGFLLKGIGLAVVVGIGYLIKKITDHRRAIRERDEGEDNMVMDLIAGIIPDPGVPAEITNGVGAVAAGARPNLLFQRINNYRFRYSGGSFPARVGFGAHTGDCLTLANMYVAAANVFGIPTVINQNINRQLVAARVIHGRNTQGNTEGNNGWYFGNHFWVTAGGNVYDLLFMNVGAVPAMNSNGHAVHNNVTYYTFPDGRCVIEAGAMNLNYQIEGEAKVFVNAAATQVFINAHP